MTREERENAIKVIKNYDLNFPEINGMLFKPGEIANAFECALEALDQEPVIDKIRAEIWDYIGGSGSEYTDGYNDGLYYAIDVIDKYRQEG